MIDAFSKVEAQYNSLKPTSRAAKNLSIWGFVLASDYKSDREKANTMWQHIININILHFAMGPALWSFKTRNYLKRQY